MAFEMWIQWPPSSSPSTVPLMCTSVTESSPSASQVRCTRPLTGSAVRPVGASGGSPSEPGEICAETGLVPDEGGRHEQQGQGGDEDGGG